MRFALSVILIAAVSLLLASDTVGESDSQRAVRIAGATYLGDLPTYVADELGFFTDRGLAATVKYSDSGKQNMALLRAGNVDFALMALTPFVLDRVADANPGEPDDPVILASLLQSYELTAVIASGDSGIEQPADFRGRRVAVEGGTNTEFVWWLFEQFHGIDGSSVERVSIPFPEMPDAFVSDRVDAVVLPEPWASTVISQLDRMGEPAARRFDTSSLYAGRWVIVTTPQHIRQRPQVARKVLGTYRQAIEFIERMPGDAISIYTGRVEISAIQADLHWEALDFDMSLDWALIASLREQFRWALEVGTGNSGQPVRMLELLAPAPLRDVWPQAVNVPLAGNREATP